MTKNQALNETLGALGAGVPDFGIIWHLNNKNLYRMYLGFKLYKLDL